MCNDTFVSSLEFPAYRCRQSSQETHCCLIWKTYLLAVHINQYAYFGTSPELLVKQHVITQLFESNVCKHSLYDLNSNRLHHSSWGHVRPCISVQCPLYLGFRV